MELLVIDCTHEQWVPAAGTFYRRSLADISHRAEFTIDTIRRLKCHLLATGLVVDSNAWLQLADTAKLPQQVRSGASCGLDIVLPTGVWANVVVHPHPQQPNTPTLQVTSEGFVLQHEAESIPIAIVPRPRYYSQRTSQGEDMSKVGQMCADRIGFGITNNCYFWAPSRRCQFCSIGANKANELPDKSLDSVLETLEAALTDPILPARHVLLSGGTPTSPDWGVQLFSHYARAIKARFDVPIYLMTVPPPELSQLAELHAAGIDEIALNIEIWDTNLAARLIPGKHHLIGRDRYLDALRFARTIWTAPNVRSLLVAGCEPISSTIDGVRAILDAGAVPILSAFRPLPGSNMYDHRAASPESFIQILNVAGDLVRTHQSILGPACKPCQCNVLA